MTTNLPSNVIQFAAGDAEMLALMESFKDYWNQYRSEYLGNKKYSFSTTDKNGNPVSFADKEKAINAALLREVSKMSGVDLTGSKPLEQLMTHPMVNWAVGNIVSQMIDAILPDTVIDSTSAYAEVRSVGFGESAIFDIESRDLFLVSRAGQLSMREAEMHRGYEGQVAVNPEMRQITVGISLFRLISGLESLARFTVKAIRSIETAMSREIFDTWNTAMGALDSTTDTGLRVSGFSQKDMVQLAQRVSAYLGGAVPYLLGTKAALQSVVPDDPNYIYDIESPFITLGHVKQMSGVNILELPQVANMANQFATYLPDNRLYIVAPGADKLIKVVLGGASVSNVSSTYDKATLLQNATFWKSWKSAVVTSSIGATIDLS